MSEAEVRANALELAKTLVDVGNLIAEGAGGAGGLTRKEAFEYAVSVVDKARSDYQFQASLRSAEELQCGHVFLYGAPEEMPEPGAEPGAETAADEAEAQSEPEIPVVLDDEVHF